ncbi:CAP domain-containing protein [bacterium]|nr:CAP domain-containing protein [bacterium]
MKLLLLLLFTMSAILGQAATLTTNEVFVRLQNVIESDKGLNKLITDLENIDSKELETLLKDFDKTWPQMRDRYLKDYGQFVKASFSGSAKTEATREIRRYRADFMEVYVLGEVPMKPLLKTKSMPAIEGLRKLIMPSAAEIFAKAPLALEKQRKLVLILAKFRDGIVDTAVLHSQEEALKGIIAKEKEVIASYGGLPRDGIRIMSGNDKIAENAKIPADEREGIREVNEWRLLLGLNALVIDPKLCDAGRGHSEDMDKNNFFAHESPLPGKKTPWDRAGIEGTKASGENIYMGSPSPASANKGWFYSPGHHKNMFKARHQRIGLGRYGRHWTQMFG